MVKIADMVALGHLKILLVILVGECLGQCHIVQQSFVAHRVVPDVVGYPPRSSLEVYYPTGAQPTQGNILWQSQLKQKPYVKWRANPHRYYTLIVSDPDAPSRFAPKDREWLHWLVINIPGDKLAAGETIFDYLPPGPPPDTGLHRYVFLVYQQPSRISFTGSRELQNRGKFSADQFAAQHNLGVAYAGNFFLTQSEASE